MNFRPQGICVSITVSYMQSNSKDAIPLVWSSVLKASI